MEKKPKAFIIVGHSDWENSLTLKLLTNNTWHFKY